MRTFFCLLSVFTFSLYPLKIEITQGAVQPDPIAVVDFAGGEEGQLITDIIKNDLTASGLFLPLDKKAFLKTSLQLLSGKPNMNNWRPMKARFLAFGQVKNNSGNLEILYHLYDVKTGALMQTKSFSGTKKTLRRIAHLVADSIYSRVTGEDGFFDTKIIYVENVSNKLNHPKKRMMIMDWDGHNNLPLTDDKYLVLTPHISPNGQEIAYLAYRNKEARVWIFDLKTRKSRELGKFNGMTFAPNYAPDSRSLTLSFERDGKSAIYLMDLVNKKLKQLSTHRSIDTSPCFSPDGKSIAFISDRDGVQPQLFIMDVDGTNVRRISFGNGRYFQPSWSPRGDLIAFTKQRGKNFYIGVISPDGSGERLICQDYLVETPSWSPNGRYVIFSRQRFGGDKIQIEMIDLTGRHSYKIPTAKGAIDGSWSPLMSRVK